MNGNHPPRKTVKKILGITALFAFAGCGEIALAAQPDMPVLKIAMEITHGNGGAMTPTALTLPGEKFTVESGSKTRGDSSTQGLFGSKVDCLPESRADDKLSLDCSFELFEAEGDITRTRRMQLKFVVSMGKPTALVIGDKNSPPKIRINVTANWARMPEKVADAPPR